MATDETTELWQAHERVRTEYEDLRVGITQNHGNSTGCRNVEDERKYTKPWWKRTKNILSFALVGVAFTVLIVALVIMYRVSDAKSLPNTEASQVQPLFQPVPVSAGVGADKVSGVANSPQKYYFNVGLRADPLLQECQGPYMKRSFPDVDYALLGYDILKGYPLQVGHDPGFTLPIFQADYRAAGQTADCRYSVPNGMILIPDVACVTSFSSKIIQTRYELAKSLSTSVSASGGGWGVHFSASFGYKQSSASMSSGESLLIISKASCDYYYSKLLRDRPPPFHPLFIEWVRRLDAASESDTTVYIDFFKQYGTHFLSEVTFGASFAYEHEMKTKQYESMTEKGVNVAVSASYSGIVSVGGGFNLDTSQKESASEFQKSVTTKTITRGAPPPANGDALTWASTVKENPVPVNYQLLTIEELFRKEYMGSLNVDHQAIYDRIQGQKVNYCTYLKEKGQVDSCKGLSPGLVLENTRLGNHYLSVVADLATCQDKCVQDKNCIALARCKTCKDFYAGRCFFYSKNQNKTAVENSEWGTTIFRPKISDKMILMRTSIQGVKRNEKSEGAESSTVCMEWCLQDEQCISYSFCSNDCAKPQNCALFGQDGITGLKADINTDSYILGQRTRMSKISPLV